MNIYNFIVKDAKGYEFSLRDYAGKVLLIVNTATGCGFTPQYKGLEALYRKYRDQGFEILDFPCNQFGNQAPGNEEEIQTFCQKNYQTSFRLMKKVQVNGKGEEPLFRYLKEQKRGIAGKAIKWNFTKFLIGRNGEVLARFAPATEGEEMEKKVSEALNL